ncbi:MAG: uridine-cytidine kinase [Cytophagaceae bacterium]|jgi:uridine kinase|nr:uridine-cytidine kinase [Cytophagaceae bacterium]
MTERLTSKPYLIGISGGSASGKTYFVQQLKERIGSASVCFISQDEYYKPRHLQKKDENGVYNFDLPEAIDHESLLQDLQNILQGKTILKKEYTFNDPSRVAQTFQYTPSPVIVMEGIFILHYPSIRALLDLSIFIQASKNIKWQRRISRDLEERGYDAEHVQYTQHKHVDVAYKQYIKPCRRVADIIINNNEHGFEKGVELLHSLVLQKMHWP